MVFADIFLLIVNFLICYVIVVNPYIHDPYYILILDARSQSEYELSHVLTANWHYS